MQVFYPKFLNTNPKFLGFSLLELVLITFGLLFSLSANLGAITGLIMSSLLIITNKVLDKYVDLKALKYLSLKNSHSFPDFTKLKEGM
jgi:hypothetical protein